MRAPLVIAGLIVAVLGPPVLAQSYTISTVLGGYPSNNAIAKATALSPDAAEIITTDSAGNVYFDYDNLVMKVTASTGLISRVAGTGGAGYSGDNGPALSAQLNSPQGLALDLAGNLYIADFGNSVIRKVSNGVITTVVGNGTAASGCGNAPSGGSVLQSPVGITLDSSGNLYITDQNLNCVFEVSNGNLTTLAGTGTKGHTGDNGPATRATLNDPLGVAVDSAGNVYIADTGNNMIRRISRSTGFITIAAGSEVPATGTNAGFSGDTGPATSALLNYPVDVILDSSGNLLIADSNNNRVRKVSNGIVTTVAGGGNAGLGDGGPATGAQLSFPSWLGLDSTGNLYIADQSDQRIREVSNGVITTIAGNGGIYLYFPLSLALDSAGDLYINDEGNSIGKIAVATGAISKVAGGGTEGSRSGPFGSGIPALDAYLNSPFGIALDPLGNLYISVYQYSQILEDSQGLIGTLAGDGSSTFGGDGGEAVSAGLIGPGAIVIGSAADIYFVDGLPAYDPSQAAASANDSRIRKVTKGIINTVAGNGSYGFNGDGIAATAAQLNGPQGLVVDSAGDLIVADTFNHRIRLVSASTGLISTIAGNGSPGSTGDGGLATNAKLDAPFGVALDSAGNLYIADTNNNSIRMVSASTSKIATIAGNGTAGFNGDYGPATAAQLNQPFAVAVDAAGNVYVADNGNDAIRVLTPAVSNCAYSLTGGDSPAAADGGNQTITVQTTAFCPWSVTNLPSWATVSGLSAGTGPGILTLSFSANTGASRSATITVAGQSVTVSQAGATAGPAITLVANAEGEVPTIAPNTWVEIKGSDLSPAGDSRTWQTSDFVSGQLPIGLDGVSVTVNGQPAYIYYISPEQINVLTPPGPLSGSVQVVVTNGAASSAPFSVPTQAQSPSFFVFGGGPYVAATHLNGSLIGPASLYPGSSTPATAGETIVIYGNGFGPTSTAVIAGAESQSGTLSPLPVITIGGVAAAVQFAGLNVTPGEFQFNVVVPSTLLAGDQAIVATYNGLTTQVGTLLTLQ